MPDLGPYAPDLLRVLVSTDLCNATEPLPLLRPSQMTVAVVGSSRPGSQGVCVLVGCGRTRGLARLARVTLAPGPGWELASLGLGRSRAGDPDRTAISTYITAPSRHPSTPRTASKSTTTTTTTTSTTTSGRGRQTHSPWPMSLSVSPTRRAMVMALFRPSNSQKSPTPPPPPPSSSSLSSPSTSMLTGVGLDASFVSSALVRAHQNAPASMGPRVLRWRLVEIDSEDIQGERRGATGRRERPNTNKNMDVDEDADLYKDGDRKPSRRAAAREVSTEESSPSRGNEAYIYRRDGDGDGDGDLRFPTTTTSTIDSDSMSGAVGFVTSCELAAVMRDLKVQLGRAEERHRAQMAVLVDEIRSLRRDVRAGLDPNPNPNPNPSHGLDANPCDGRGTPGGGGPARDRGRTAGDGWSTVRRREQEESQWDEEHRGRGTWRGRGFGGGIRWSVASRLELAVAREEIRGLREALRRRLVRLETRTGVGVGEGRA